MAIDVLGIDLAKTVFQLHGVDRKGAAVFKRRVMRDQLLSVVAGIEPCTIAIEACTGAFCWARQFESFGHKVKIVSPQYVKPFVRRQKNDGNDARRSARRFASPYSAGAEEERRAAGHPGPAPCSSASDKPSNGFGQSDARLASGSRDRVREVDHPGQAHDPRDPLQS